MMIEKTTCYRYCLPVVRKEKPSGVILCNREGLLFHAELESGADGWGEAAPLPGFSRETIEDVLAAARNLFLDKGSMNLEKILGAITSPALYFAFESILHQIQNCAMDDRIVSIPLCALITGDISVAHAQVEYALQQGYGTVKVKVGSADVGEDIRKIKTLLRDFTGCCHWRFDANRAWDYDAALRFCEVIAGDDGVDYVEEPLREFQRMPELQEASGVSCAVDETLQELSRCLFTDCAVYTPEQEMLLRHTVENAHALVWKPSLCMNPKRMNLDTAAPVILSAAYESGVGTAAILESAAWNTDECAAGVDTYSRLEQDILQRRLPLFGGMADMNKVRTTAAGINMNMLEEVWHV